MSDEGKWVLIITAVLVILIVLGIVFANILQLLNQHLFIYGLLVGLAIGILLTLGIIRAIRWIRRHRIVETEESQK